MYIIAAVEVLIFLSLFILSMRVDKGDLRKGILGVFDRMSKVLVLFYKHIRKKPLENQRVLAAYEQLNPGEDISKLCEKHTIEKLSLVLMLVFAGTFLGAGIKYTAGQESQKFNSEKIERSEYAGDAKNYQIEATIEGEKQIISMTIYPREFSEEEIEDMLPSFWDNLGEKLKGDNSSLDNVQSNLSTVKKLSGYPFKITWTSSKPGIIPAWNGKVTEVEEECQVFLTAKVKYKSKEYEKVYSITLVPKEIPIDQELQVELEKMISANEVSSRQEAELSLPTQINEKSIEWNLLVEDYSIQIWMGIVFVSIIVFFVSDSDVEKKATERRKQMKNEYPDIVRKLALYIGAGMTLRASFGKICDEAERHQKKNPIFYEMKYICRQMDSGLSEDEAYEKWGRRAGSQEYIRLTTLLVQNLKKGSSGLLVRLREESESAEFERLQACKQKGEEAGTKLLIPMVLLLLVVMVVIMIPAFSSMGV